MAVPVRYEEDETLAVIKRRQLRLPAGHRLAAVVPDQRGKRPGAFRLVEKSLERDGAIRKRNLLAHGLTGRELRRPRVGGNSIGERRRRQYARRQNNQRHSL